jgi:UDP-N-acetyl-D-mannosaminuronic acid dehydrogenase
LVKAFESEAKLIRTAREINEYKALWTIEKIKNEIVNFRSVFGKEPLVACLGLAFKPDIDDLRESPSFFITKQLVREGFRILPVEPNVTSLEGLKICSVEEAIITADIFAILVNHKAFRNIRTDKPILDFCGFNQKKS